MDATISTCRPDTLEVMKHTDKRITFTIRDDSMYTISTPRQRKFQTVPDFISRRISQTRIPKADIYNIQSKTDAEGTDRNMIRSGNPSSNPTRQKRRQTMTTTCMRANSLISLNARADFHKMVVSSIIGIMAIDKSEANLKLTFPPIAIEVPNMAVLTNSRYGEIFNLSS